MYRRTKPVLTTALVLSLLLAMPCDASERGKEKSKPLINTRVGGEDTAQAILGYDPVAYFTEHKAVKGSTVYQYEWKGAHWLFQSRADLDLFKAKPEDYAPQYGGYCAYGMAKDLRVGIDGRDWNILDNKLYLHNNPNVQRTWIKDFDNFIRSADRKYEAFAEPAAASGGEH